MSTIVAVGSNSTPIVGPNPYRASLTVVNDSDATVYLGLGTAAVVSSGPALPPHGGSYETSTVAGNLTRDAIYAIHSGAGPKNVRLVEVAGDPNFAGVPIPSVAELRDAQVSSPADGDVLSYVTADAKWENKPAAVPDAFKAGMTARWSGTLGGTTTGAKVPLPTLAGADWHDGIAIDNDANTLGVTVPGRYLFLLTINMGRGSSASAYLALQALGNYASAASAILWLPTDSAQTGGSVLYAHTDELGLADTIAFNYVLTTDSGGSEAGPDLDFANSTLVVQYLGPAVSF